MPTLVGDAFRGSSYLIFYACLFVVLWCICLSKNQPHGLLSSWEQYWRQRLAVCLVNYSYRMRSMIHSKAVGLATPALGASLRPLPTLLGDAFRGSSYLIFYACLFVVLWCISLSKKKKTGTGYASSWCLKPLPTLVGDAFRGSSCLIFYACLIVE